MVNSNKSVVIDFLGVLNIMDKPHLYDEVSPPSVLHGRDFPCAHFFGLV
ncbi:hypothetical protein UFOVP26_74 [uncultured Caudovirales phage]|uniref:Uncharacterized protein n=1 Tax=uncultured Caudovirales phage TaxID=2100421 RepID=A0A6J5KK94_9CAUD|nr:hypothetical protein UFOVP26_74 [uncultured Caudovirales phage]CAB4123634.1 hypothetical protein UFOVP44_23 [uncultured Caudovirales phage]CAB5218916.1 hypothetical protein UFOVP220_14 [uncultured Caudovirales phage]